MVGMLGSGHGRAGPGGRERHCGRNGSDSGGGTAAGRRPAHGRIVARRDYHCKGTSGAPDGAALGHGSGPARPAARELARALEKERARGQSVEVHYSRRASQSGVRAGTKTGPRAGAELDGQSHITPQARGDSDRAQRGRRASRARSPDSTGTRRTGEHGGAGTRDGPPPGIGSGPAGTRAWTGDWTAAAAAPRSWLSGRARFGARRRRHDKVRSSVSQVSGARHRSGASQE